jgi:hypothetical protein
MTSTATMLQSLALKPRGGGLASVDDDFEGEVWGW